MNKNDLPVEIEYNELPLDKFEKYNNIEEQANYNKSYGFANACFLGALIAFSFMLGILAIIMKGA